MILKTQEFQKVTNTITSAIDKNIGTLEIKSDGQEPVLYLAVTNKEYFLRVAFQLTEPAFIHAAVDAQLFLNLISGLTSETFELTATPQLVQISADKSKYKLPIIFENDKIIEVPEIVISNKTVEMAIDSTILSSIINVNGKEVAKVKNLQVNELQKLYYIIDTGCFTFATGACFNEFTLEKPVNLLLNGRVVKLLKLFKNDVKFTLGQDAISGSIIQTKVSFEEDNIYLAAITTCNDTLLQQIQKPFNATKNFISEIYNTHAVISANQLSAAVTRLLLFTKNSLDRSNMLTIPATVTFDNNTIILKDSLDNIEAVQVISDESSLENGYSMVVNLADLKAVLDSCKDGTITLNCGNHRSVVIKRSNINWLIPECISMNND